MSRYVDTPVFTDSRRFMPPPPPLDEDEEEGTRPMATSSVHGSLPSSPPPEKRRSRPSLGELFKKVGDATKGGPGDDEEEDNYTSSSSTTSGHLSPHLHHIIELHDMGAHNGAAGDNIYGGNDNNNNHESAIDIDFFHQRRLPFVLAFTDLTYSVRDKDRKTSSSVLSRYLPGGAGGGSSTDPTSRSGAALSPPKKHTKTLLDNISGSARDGEIVAVMGASGSGKSTLIDALASRISRDSLRGSVKLNGEHLESRLLRAISAYVMQDDLLYPMLTVEETLTYAAEFRLPRTLPPQRKRERVRQLIDQLGLRSAAGTIIGDEGHRGVSGGERRRVSIGIDIVHDPIILFLDEPTSGLDSTSAFLVVEVLQKIAASGSIVMMSIHQPSFRILGLIDRLIFLSKGRTVYSGTPDGLQPYFTEFGHPIPENENRTEFALDLIRELETSPSGPANLRRLVEFHKQYTARHALPTTSEDYGTASLKDAISASISRGKLVSGATDPVGAGPGAALAAAANSDNNNNTMKTFANPYWAEIGVLTRRSFANSRRMPELFAIRMGAVMITGFILATIFWRLDHSPKGVQERLGFFAFAMSTTFYTCADALPVFLQERYIFMRETAYNAYRRSSYVLANSLVAIPALILLSAAFAATTFFAVGLAGGFQGFAFYFLIILASFWAGSSFVTFLSGVVSNVMMGYTVVVAILAYFLLFSGFFITRQRIPDYWIWFHYLSLVKYPYEAVLHNEFDGTARCFVQGTQIFDNSPLGAVPDAIKEALLKSMSGTLGMNITTHTCLTTGSDVLKQQGVMDLSKWNCLWITFAWGFLFRILFYFALLLGSKNKRT